MDLTPTERKLYDKLKDGMAHSHAELMPLLWDDMSTLTALAYHMSNLRGKLKVEGQDIIGRNGHYCLVRLIRSA